MGVGKMEEGGSVAIAASALRAQQARMRVIAENLANSNSTGAAPGQEPYRRQVPVFRVKDLDGAQGVEMSEVRPDPKPFGTEYRPGDPAADANGYVRLPNVDSLVESMDMKEAMRAYSANISVIETDDALEKSALSLLQQIV